LTKGAESEDRNDVSKTEGKYKLVKREARTQRNKAKTKSSKKKKIDTSGRSSRTSKQKKANNKSGARNALKKISKKKASKNNTRDKSSRKVKQQEGEVASRATTDCLPLFKEYARVNELKATNIQNQVNRIRSFSDIQAKKQAKKDNFGDTLNTLLNSLGGDISNPTCDGVPINSTNYTSYQTNLETLAACDANIDTVCGDLANGNETENATLTDCLDAAVQFKADFLSCTSKQVPDTCACIDGIDKDNYNFLKDCDTTAKNKEATRKKKACIKSFQACKIAQDDSVSGVDLCKEKNRCAGAKSKEEAEKQLQVLNPLRDALIKSSVVTDSLASLGLDGGAGSDGQWPASGGATADGTDGEGCKELDAEWTSFNETAGNAASSANGDLDDTNANTTTETLNRINSRANLTADLASCAPESSGRQLTITLRIVRIRIFLFWCFWWRVTVIEIKIVILTVSFGVEPTPPPTTIAPTPGTPPVTTTTATTLGPATTITDEISSVTIVDTTPSVTTDSPARNKRFLRDILKRSIGN